MFRKSFLLSLAGLVCVATAAETPAHRLRLLTVGSPPPFIQEVRDGVRHEVPAAAGTIPPRVVTLPSPLDPDKTEAGNRVPIRLRLGQITAPVQFAPPESGRLGIESDNGVKWLEVPLHPSGASLALVWRGGKDWSEPRTIVVPDDAQARAEGNVHFANLTAAPMAITIGAEKIRLDPGKTFTRRMTPGAAALALDISYVPSSGELKRCHSASLEPTRGCFHRIIIYAADGRNPRLPVKVLQLEEPG